MSAPLSSVAAAGAKGPLRSTLGQWTFILLGGYALSGDERISQVLLTPTELPQQQIVVRSDARYSSGDWVSWLISALRIPLGGVGLWWLYRLISQKISETIFSATPVARTASHRAFPSLCRSIMEVRYGVARSLLSLTSRHDELKKIDEETKEDSRSTLDRLSILKDNFINVHSSLERCELGLADAETRLSYASRGVKLLLQCLPAMLPMDTSLAEDLQTFSYEEDPEEEKHQIDLLWQQRDPEEHTPESTCVLSLERVDSDSVPEQTETEADSLSDTESFEPESTSLEMLDDVRVLLQMVSGQRGKGSLRES